MEHRQRDLFSAQGAFYAAHREEVDESHRQAHARWKEWMDSWMAGYASRMDLEIKNTNVSLLKLCTT